MQPTFDECRLVIREYSDQLGQFGRLLGEVEHQVGEAPQEVEAIEESLPLSPGQQALLSLAGNLALGLGPIPYAAFGEAHRVGWTIGRQRRPVGERVADHLALQALLDVFPEATPVVTIQLTLPVGQGHRVEIHTARLVSPKDPGVGQHDSLQSLSMDLPG